jgi:putative NIF3 family GTP cyclohydrolase 1 type 2
LISSAAASGAEAFLSGDITHHAALEARDRGLFVLDAGHYATERVVVEPLARRLQHLLHRYGFHAEVVASTLITDPVSFA